MKANVNRISKFLGDDDLHEFNRVPDETHLPSDSHRSTGVGADTLIQDDDIEEDDVDAELADILNHYLEQLESGTPTSVEELVADHPQYEEALREYLAGLHLLNAGIAEMSDSPFRFEDDRPQTLGDYELVREIGRGGMGVVYEARQISLDRRVALKVLPFAAMLDQRQIARFDAESRAAAGLQHPHIVPVHGVGLDRGVHYYAMQFIEGSSVRERIDAAKETPDEETSPREAARLGVQAASALHTAHSCGVVHRDIKPSNLLLDANNDLWIADFGLARTQSDNSLTMSGDVLGTLHYMSPEQTRGNSSLADPRSDIYSLGVTLYELLTLRRAFHGDSHTEVLQQIELGKFRPLRTLNPDVPRDLENVVTKAMSVDPNHRYQSAADLEADLTRFMDGRATLAKPPSMLQRIACWASRNRILVASLFAVLTVSIVALACTTFWLARERADLAEKNQIFDKRLDLTDSTLETFGMETAERLKQIPGSELARKALLGDLLAHYEEMLVVSENDQSIREDRAITSTKIANIHRESGDLQQALNVYRSAEADFRLIVETETGLRRTRASELLAKCHCNMSVVLLELDRVQEAAQIVRRAIDIQAELLAADPSTSHAIDLAASYTNLAAIEFDRTGAGLAELKRAEAIAVQARHQCSPEEEPEILKGLATTYGRLTTLLRTKDVSEATAYAAKAAECTQNLLLSESEPAELEFRQLHALHCNNLASLYFDQGRHSEAIKMYKQAAMQMEATQQLDELVRTLVNLAKTQAHAGSLRSVAKTYEKAITVQASLLLESPGDLNHVSRLGGLHNNHALALQKLGKNQHASIAYESAIEFQDRAYQLAPKHLDYYRDALSRTFFNASKASLKVGKPHLAAELQLRRSALWPGDSQQLFSAARNIAAAIDRMPANDPQRKRFASKADTVLDTAVGCDATSRLAHESVSKLRDFLLRNGRS